MTELEGDLLRLLRAMSSPEGEPGSSTWLGGVRVSPEMNVELLDDPSSDRAAGVRSLLVDVPTGTFELRWCPDRGVPWAVAAGDDWAEPLICSCGTANIFLADVMLALGGAAGRSRGLLAQIRRQCVLSRILEESGISPTPQEVADELGRLAAARGVSPETLVAELARSGFSRQQIDDYLRSRAATATLRRTVVGDAITGEDGSVVEAWWLTCPRPPAQGVLARLARSDARTARDLAAALHADDPAPSDFVSTRRPRLLLPEFLRRCPVPAVRLAEDAVPGWRCGGVVRRCPAGTIDEDARRRVEALLFQRWVDERPENADVQWHWHA